MREEVKKLIEKIEGMSDRIAQLKMQGESSAKPPIKSLRHRRIVALRELVDLLCPQISYYDGMVKEKGK